MKKQLLTALLALITAHTGLAQWTIFDAPDGGKTKDLCTNGASVFALTPSFIYESQDNGNNWSKLPATVDAGALYKRLEAGKNALYAIDPNNTLHRSNDQGATWKNILGPNYPRQYLGQAITGLMVFGDTVLVSTQYAMYRSENQGENWSETGDFFNEEIESFFEFNNEIFAWGGPIVYRSSNRGLTWEKAFATVYPFKLVNATEKGIFLLYDDAQRIVYSTDGLRTWTTKSSNLDNYHTNKHRMFVQDSDTIKLLISSLHLGHVECHNPIFTSLDGITWTTPNNTDVSAPLTFLNDVLTLPGGRILMAATEGIKYSDDALKTYHWSHTNIREADLAQFEPRAGTVLTQEFGVAHQLDLTTGTWKTINAGYSDNDCVRHREYLGTDTRLYSFRNENFFSSQNAFYSDDEGSTWDTITTLQNYNHQITASKNSLWISRNKYFQIKNGTTELVEKQLDIQQTNGDKPTTLIARKNELWSVTAQNGFAVFSDEGALIKYFPPLNFCPLATTSTLKYFYDGQRAWGICGDETYVFHRDSTRWNEVYLVDWPNNVALYNYRISTIEAFNGSVLLATDKGIFVNNGKDNRCYPISPVFPIPDRIVSMRVSGDTLWAATDRTHKMLMLKLNGEQWESGTTPQFTAEPNPSTGALRLKSDVFIGDALQMEVLDAAGRRIRTLPIGGGNQWNFELNALASGVYILHIYGLSGINSLKWVKQ